MFSWSINFAGRELAAERAFLQHLARGELQRNETSVPPDNSAVICGRTATTAVKSLERLVKRARRRGMMSGSRHSLLIDDRKLPDITGPWSPKHAPLRVTTTQRSR